MPRILMGFLVLLSLTSAARSDTPPSRRTDNYALLYQAHSDNRLLRGIA